MRLSRQQPDAGAACVPGFLRELVAAGSGSGLGDADLELGLEAELFLRRELKKLLLEAEAAPAMLQQLLRRAELLQLRSHAVAVSFDPDSAHLQLVLSQDGREVRCCSSSGGGGGGRGVPETPGRFTCSVFVLGRQSFGSGRFYFQVRVGGKAEWAVGVARRSVQRSGPVRLRPQDGFWTVWWRDGDLRALAGPSERLRPRPWLRAVGVFVDYEDGRVSFYDGDTAERIYSFSGFSFTDTLLPFSDPGPNDDGLNGEPLVIERLT